MLRSRERRRLRQRPDIVSPKGREFTPCRWRMDVVGLPVCLIGEPANTHRMGAAVTYTGISCCWLALPSAMIAIPPTCARSLADDIGCRRYEYRKALHPTQLSQ